MLGTALNAWNTTVRNENAWPQGAYRCNMNKSPVTQPTHSRTALLTQCVDSRAADPLQSASLFTLSEVR